MAQPLFKILDKLLKLHKSLYQIAVEKTEVLKKGDLEALNNLMKNEQSHISAIQMVEKERVKLMQELLPGKKEATLQECLALFTGNEKEDLEALQEGLTQQLLELKTVNDLNQQLLEQSLQVVSLNLDLLVPNNPANYSKDEEEDMPNLSIFDSKA
ncbi:flagellar protein FlgN [Robertmurraya kyonggiensis]|uniref:Flagellar protein FlgN n=1 Tax=Robertmurraya kyonggiensis TaxID=1037680 RepID=A0A4U1D3X8_9BACI|nr:flagellar protein FlgN [Robertmurraya kyonggiensis]TKC17031.1 flagellar protein FlgN [Robertmurraya kyonggiensis]